MDDSARTKRLWDTVPSHGNSGTKEKNNIQGNTENFRESRENKIK